MSIRFKLMLLLSCLFSAAIGNAVLSLQLESNEAIKLQWVLHTHKIINNTEKLLSSMKDAETGQRGFLLTKTKIYLAPYYTGVVDAEKYFNVLKELISDNQLQQKRLRSIERLMHLKFNELALTIDSVLENKGDNREALALVKQDKGKKYMDDIRRILSEFNHAEALLLEQRESEFGEHKTLIMGVLVFEIAFFILLAFITVLFLNKNLFSPLKLLVANIHKMEKGKKLDITEVTANDEMGYLLSCFFKMYKKIEERTELLTYTACHDELTGLKNRVNLYNEIENSISKLKGSELQFAVFFVDLNKFKPLNDTLGHDVGDLILKETASRLKGAVRSNDTVFRVGGDEFIVLINDVKAISDMRKIATKLLDVSAAPIMFQGQALEISLSIGIAVSDDNIKNSKQIVTFADMAMYEAKQDKENNYKFFDKSMLKRSSDAS